MKKMNKKGFTLVEIMIVVAIIGLLAAIGIPSFTRARSSSIERAKENNVRIVDSAVEQWAMENGIIDGSGVTLAITNYIKGGLGSLDVGNMEITSDSITGIAVGDNLTTNLFSVISE